MSLRIVRISAGATLQDAGRPGWRRFGVPPGGAFDRDALRLGNALLGGEPFTPALEMALFGGRFEALARVRLCVVGAVAQVKALRRGESAELSMGSAFTLESGDVLEVGAFRDGVRGYICAWSGFRGEQVLGSVSGTPVKAGDVLETAEAPPHPVHALRRLPLPARGHDRGPLRLIAVEGLPKESHRKLFGPAFRVSLDSDRRGVRLEGEPVIVGEERPSEPLCVGAVQATPRGQLLVIGPDGPTIGGYPKVGVVCLADLSRLAQLPPGETVRFEPVDYEGARRLWKEHMEAIEQIVRP